MSRKRRREEQRKVVARQAAFNAEAVAARKQRERREWATRGEGPVDVIEQAVALAVITHGKGGGEAVVEQALRLLGMADAEVVASRGGGALGRGHFRTRVRRRLAQQGVELGEEAVGEVLAAAETLRGREEVRGKRL